MRPVPDAAAQRGGRAARPAVVISPPSEGHSTHGAVRDILHRFAQPYIPTPDPTCHPTCQHLRKQQKICSSAKWTVIIPDSRCCSSPAGCWCYSGAWVQ